MTPQYYQHHNDESFDEVTFRVVPRYKTSGMSGDEWRVCTVVELKRKGTLIYSRSYGRLSDAAAHFPWLLRTVLEGPSEDIPNWMPQINRDRKLCHQPGCAEKATRVYQLKKLFSREGYEGESSVPLLRGFCERHKTRGDCGLEDADRNYTGVREA
jgi:hypothetical protein